MSEQRPLIGATYQSVLGAVISVLRSEGNSTQTDIAKELGITVSTWSRIERGESAISLEQLVEVAKFLKVPLSNLFLFAEEKIGELKKQGVTIAVSKKALKEENILQLSTAQLIGMAIMVPGIGMLGGTAVAVAYGVYKSLKKSSDKPESD